MRIHVCRCTPWNDFFELVKAVSDSSFTVSFDSFRVTVGRLEKKRNQLLRNKKDEVGILFEEPFCGVHTVSTSPAAAEDDALAKEEAKTEELTAKLKHLSVRNVNKRIKRRDLKISESQAQVCELDSERQSQDKHKLEAQLHTTHNSVHCLRQRLYRSRDKVEATSHESSDL